MLPVLPNVSTWGAGGGPPPPDGPEVWAAAITAAPAWAAAGSGRPEWQASVMAAPGWAAIGGEATDD